MAPCFATETSLEGRQRKACMSKVELPEAQVLTVLSLTVTHGFLSETYKAEVGLDPHLIEGALHQRIQSIHGGWAAKACFFCLRIVSSFFDVPTQSRIKGTNGTLNTPYL